MSIFVPRGLLKKQHSCKAKKGYEVVFTPQKLLRVCRSQSHFISFLSRVSGLRAFVVLRHRVGVCGQHVDIQCTTRCVAEDSWAGFSRLVRASSIAMTKRRKKAEPSRGAPGEWVECVRGRRQRQEHYTTSRRGRQPAAFWMEEEEAVGSDLESRASRLDFTMYTVEELLAAYQRLVLSASLKLAAYEPSHYTTMVCGRPVQVIICYISAMCHHVQLLLSMLPFVFVSLSFFPHLAFDLELCFLSVSLIPSRVIAVGLSQVIVLSHEGARAEEWMPYFSARFHPCRPIWFLGRASRRSPTCAPKSAVFHWFQDRCSQCKILISPPLPMSSTC